MAIGFQNQEIEFKLKEVLRLKNWIKKVIANEGKKPGQLNFVYTSDEELFKINVKFLNHHTYTDIITFDYCEGKMVQGDIMISVDRVKENAQKFKVEFEQELRRVMIHGVLHLCGYKDKSEKDSIKMRAKENQALKIF
ncbi:MAG: rRNA maturation RNase YbeY [Bacteroidia bacterium]|nr:rRNA maturation RNase YbeY [Bacteroidia bacterium]